MNKPQTEISKLISYWLRHNPKDADIVLDVYGWANIDDILEALRTRDIQLSKTDLIELSQRFAKVRWKIDLESNKIKSTHGHSIQVLQEIAPKTPPKILYHGTGIKNMDSIAKDGLKSMQRQYVHLAETIAMATEIGSRHGKPVIIKIDTTRLLNEGWHFYKTEEDVWLTKNIPAKYLDF